MSQNNEFEKDEQISQPDQTDAAASPDLQPSPQRSGGKLSTWIGLAVGVLGGCCIILIVIVLFLSRLGFPGIPNPFATPTPLPIPGIDAPVIVNGLEIRITSAQFQDSYKMLDRTFRASKAGETLLVVKGFSPTADMGKTKNWKVTVSDEAENVRSSNITVTSTKNDQLELVWVFAVSKNSNTFTLQLPDNQTVDLSTILNK